MTNLVQIDDSLQQKPDWFTIRPPTSEKFTVLREKFRSQKLHTVCQESHCPNQAECWSGGTATFMILGDTCTRACRFCAVKTAFPALAVDEKEPKNLAEAVKFLDLDYLVITSVDRDDLADQGASHFAECIKAVKESNPKILVEVLTPDFRGDLELVATVINAKPDVYSHNVETVRRLQNKVRDPRANYEQSLQVLRFAKDLGLRTKSSIMLGLGETQEEVLETMHDLRQVGTDFLTLGQYLRPSPQHLEVKEFVHPDRFKSLEKEALNKGFKYCASGPFVRSSYKAGEYFIKNLIGQRKHS